MSENANLPLAVGSNFLRNHAGAVTADLRVAILELVANVYDAGATRVEINWPSGAAGEIKVIDNGIGMTRDEISRRWETLSHSRIQEQGAAVTFPLESKSTPVRRSGGMATDGMAPFVSRIRTK